MPNLHDELVTRVKVRVSSSTMPLQITHLEDTMQKKDFDMQVMEERYKKYIEKAKSVIKTLDPKTAGTATAGNALAGGQAEVGQLRTQLNEKEQRIETMEHVSALANSLHQAYRDSLDTRGLRCLTNLKNTIEINRIGISYQSPIFRKVSRVKTRELKCNCIAGDGEGEGGARDGGAADVVGVLQPLDAHAPPGRRGAPLQRHRRTVLPRPPEAAPGTHGVMMTA